MDNSPRVALSSRAPKTYRSITGLEHRQQHPRIGLFDVISPRLKVEFFRCHARTFLYVAVT